MGNGFMAVIAGIISQLSADFLGDIGPFQVMTTGKISPDSPWEKSFQIPLGFPPLGYHMMSFPGKDAFLLKRCV